MTTAFESRNSSYEGVYKQVVEGSVLNVSILFFSVNKKNQKKFQNEG